MKKQIIGRQVIINNKFDKEIPVIIDLASGQLISKKGVALTFENKGKPNEVVYSNDPEISVISTRNYLSRDFDGNIRAIRVVSNSKFGFKSVIKRIESQIESMSNIENDSKELLKAIAGLVVTKENFENRQTFPDFPELMRFGNLKKTSGELDAELDDKHRVVHPSSYLSAHQFHTEIIEMTDKFFEDGDFYAVGFIMPPFNQLTISIV